MPIFSPLASAGFNTAPFVPPIDDYILKITRLSISAWEWNDVTNLKITMAQRIESDNVETNNKALNREFNFGTMDKETGEVLTCDMSKIAEVAHAAFGFENRNASEDERFNERFGADAFQFDTSEMRLIGNEWDQLIGCSYKASVKAVPGKNDRTNIYFNDVRPVDA